MESLPTTENTYLPLEDIAIKALYYYSRHAHMSLGQKESLLTLIVADHATWVEQGPEADFMPRTLGVFERFEALMVARRRSLEGVDEPYLTAYERQIREGHVSKTLQQIKTWQQSLTDDLEKLVDGSFYNELNSTIVLKKRARKNKLVNR